MPPLRSLCVRLAEVTRERMRAALASGSLDAVARPCGRGAGDTTYGLDAAAEEVLTDWLEERAVLGPISLLTEDAGWRHRGPGADGRPRDLPGFDHGGPRIAIDPIDGTRNLMTDLRAAWTVVSVAGPGRGEPRYTDLVHGLVAEIPDSRGAHARVLEATRGAGCRVSVRELASGTTSSEGALVADDDDRVDHGYYPFFAYASEQRPAVARLAATFFERLARLEGADVRNCYDDQYISSGGQLALLALGTYRMIVEPRRWLARGRPAVVAKPYDMAGAALCAEEAGCVVTALDGTPLDFPIDVHTAVGFAGFANAATARRLRPHLDAALTATGR